MRGGVSRGPRAVPRRARARRRAAPEPRLRASNGAGILAAEQGDFDAARGLFEDALARTRALGVRDREARDRLQPRHPRASTRGDFDDGDRAATRTRRTSRASSATSARVSLLHAEPRDRARRGWATCRQAIALLEESVEIARRVAEPAHSDVDARSRSRACCSTTTRSARSALLRLALERAHEIRDSYGLVGCLETAAAAAGRRGDPRAGAQLWGAADAAAGGPGHHAPAGRAALRRARGGRAARGARRRRVRGRGRRGRRARARGGRQPRAANLKRDCPALDSHRRQARGAVAQREGGARPRPRAGSRPRGRRAPGR